MTKIWYNSQTGSKAVFDDAANIADWPDFQETPPPAIGAREADADNRDKRKRRIEATDWWAVSDRTMTEEEIAYRQGLRDITAHANWPHLEEADWPSDPKEGV